MLPSHGTIQKTRKRTALLTDTFSNPRAGCPLTRELTVIYFLGEIQEMGHRERGRRRLFALFLEESWSRNLRTVRSNSRVFLHGL